MKQSFDACVRAEAERLWALGFGLLWLQPKSKRPIKKAWTTGERESWGDFLSGRVPGANLGVRLGAFSKVGGHYLQVVDVDVKNPAYKDEALSKYFELVKEVPHWRVSTGRGNGSLHGYFLSSAPYKTWNYVKNEHYEISLYSRGRQTVLPPSIHPETGKAYIWSKVLREPLTLVDFIGGPKESTDDSAKKSKKESNRSVDDIEWKPFVVDETLDIRWLPGISDDMRAAIIDGTDVSDRSQKLYFAAKALRGAGLERDSILTVLTDPNLFLGKTAAAHTGNNDRQVQARWVERFTLAPEKRKNDPKSVFEAAPLLPGDEPPPLEEWEKEVEQMKIDEESGYRLAGERGASIVNQAALFNRFCFDHAYKTIADMRYLYIYNGTHYVDFLPPEVKAYPEKLVRPAPNESERKEFEHKLFANQVVRRTFFTETTEGKMNFSNGVLDLTDPMLEMRPHSPEYGFRGVLPYAFDLNAKCPAFISWLKYVLLEDQSLINVVQEFMGYIIRGGDYKYHKALWLGGRGRNGKSTFIDVLKALIGSGNYSTISIKALVGDKFAGSVLDGAIANFSEETSTHELADSGPFKNLTGDGETLAQKKFGDPYSMRNRAKLVMTYNQIPDLKDGSDGMLSRPLIIPFERKIPFHEQDVGMKEKLLAELPGIFNFAYEGWLRLERQKRFSASPKSDAALKMVKEESCPVYQWVENYVEELSGPHTRDEGVYLAILVYEIYCKSHKHPYNSNHFFQRLSEHPLMKSRKSRKDNKAIFWGIKIRDNCGGRS